MPAPTSFKIEIPEWFKHVAKDSYIRKTDILGMFNLTLDALNHHIARGHFPKPDKYHESKKHFGQWRADTIRKFVKAQKS
jgi:hypothetical protein